MTRTLHIYALNRPSELRHTHLTRAQGARPDLPPLAGWLGVGDLDTSEIEIFPVSDLGDMGLSDYVATAFATREDIPPATRAQIDALSGSVLLVPDLAMTGTPHPGADLILMATLPLAQPDNSMDMDPVPVNRIAAPPAPDEMDENGRSGPGGVVWIVLAVVVIVVLLGILL